MLNGGRELGWDDAIQAVLHASADPLHYVEISERISAQGLKQKIGANPSNQVASILSRSLKNVDSPFVKLGRGLYGLKDRVDLPASAAVDEIAVDAEDIETGALRAFGMFWQRSYVSWTGPAKLFGLQQLGATQVNFAEQAGVYLLHDRERVIYVGRATSTLYARLKYHTTDRLGGRWDRFSWFGLRSVGEDGSLAEAPISWTHEVVIETLEALLIEAMEPPLNRKGGDNLSGVEYLQVADPEIEKRRKKELMNELAKRAGLSE